MLWLKNITTTSTLHLELWICFQQLKHSAKKQAYKANGIIDELILWLMTFWCVVSDTSPPFPAIQLFLYRLQKHTFVIRVHLFLITRLRFHFSCCRHKFHLLYSLPSAILIHEKQKQSLTHVFTRDPWNALSTILLFYDPICLLGYNRLITFVYAIHLPVISYVNTWARPRTSF